MKAVLQRVSRASVTVDGQKVAEIGSGILALVGVERGDSDADVDYLFRKISEIRMFEDAEGKMNLSVRDAGGSVLLVSQFTLCATTKKGRRPGFDDAAAPELAEQLYERLAAKLRESGLPTQTGRFAARMDVELVNQGPVTFLLDSRR